MLIISLREQPQFLATGLRFLQKNWSDISPLVYENCLTHCLDSPNKLPQWYFLQADEAQTIGCAGLIPNDFISRMDLTPWLCALFIDELFRGQAYSRLLILKAKDDAKRFGFKNLYLASDLIGFYEKIGFKSIGLGFYPDGSSSTIYTTDLNI